MDSMTEQLSSITDASNLCPKRGVWKGAITKIKNHYRSIDSVTFQHQSLMDLQKRAEVLEEHVNAFKIIQDRIEEAIGVGDSDEDAEDISDKRRLNHDLAYELEFLIRAVRAWDLGVKIQEDVAELNDATSLTGVFYRKKCETLWSEHNTFKKEVRSLTAYNKLSSLREDIKPSISHLQTRYDRDLKEVASPSPAFLALPYVVSMADSVSHSPVSHLRLQLPSFSGYILEWRDF